MGRLFLFRCVFCCGLSCLGLLCLRASFSHSTTSPAPSRSRSSSSSCSTYSCWGTMAVSGIDLKCVSLGVNSWLVDMCFTVKNYGPCISTKGITPLASTNHGMFKPEGHACRRNLETYLGTYDFCNVSKKPWPIITPWNGVMFGQGWGNVETLNHHYPLLTIGKRGKYGKVDLSCNKPYLCNYRLGWNKKQLNEAFDLTVLKVLRIIIALFMGLRT